MSFKLSRLLAKRRAFEMIIYSLFLMLLSSLIVVFMSISLTLPNHFKTMINESFRLVFWTQEIDLDKINFDFDYFVLPNNSNQNIYISISVDDEIIDSPLCFSSLSDKSHCYISKDYSEKMGLIEGEVVNVTIGEKTYCFDILISDLQYNALYIDFQYFNSSIVGMMEVELRNYDEVHNFYQFAKENIDLSDFNDYGLLALYNNIKSIQVILIFLCILIFGYLVLSIINFINHHFINNSKQLSLIKMLGLSNNDLFIMEIGYFSGLGFISLFLGGFIAKLILIYFSDYSILIFDKRIYFHMLWYLPLLILVFYIIAFFIIGGRIINHSISKVNVIDYVKEGEV